MTNWITRQMPVDAEQQEALKKTIARNIGCVESGHCQSRNRTQRKLGAKQALPRVSISQLAGLVIDSEQSDGSVDLVGEWQESVSVRGFVANHYLHDSSQLKGKKKATFNFTLPQPGQYEVRVSPHCKLQSCHKRPCHNS